MELHTEKCALLETNIDHRTPEALAFVCEELLAGGALDVWQEPIYMKKGRLAVKLCVLSALQDKQRLTEQIIRTTGTLGVRTRNVERAIANRKVVILDTPYGQVQYKLACYHETASEVQSISLESDLASYSEEVAWLRPEHDGVAQIARDSGKDYQDVLEELLAIGRQHLRDVSS